MGRAISTRNGANREMKHPSDIVRTACIRGDVGDNNEEKDEDKGTDDDDAQITSYHPHALIMTFIH